MEERILEVLDTRGVLRCVRFESGNVGVVNRQGETLLVVGLFQQLRFAGNGFLRMYNGREFFIDMKNGELYTEMPEFVHFGDFEIAHIGGFLCTRTKKLYEVQAIPAEAWLGKQGLYLKLPYSGEPEERILWRMLKKQKRYEVCLLNGDESGVYWFISLFGDGSLLVMDDNGNYYHVQKSARSRRALKRQLGQVENETDKVVILQAVREIEEQVVERLKREAMKMRREVEREREKQMERFVSAEPFHIGNKWGLRNKGCIVVPPLYRNVKSPVGRYCAFERNPGQWGVLALDGKIEVEANYEHVEIYPDGTVELTVWPKKKLTKKLPL